MKTNCPEWLTNAVFYEIYPQSFNDTNKDGIGDFEGIIQKLDYIKSLGCNAIWINPCFASPFGDAGYDVADFYKIAPRYGTNADAKRLFREAKKRGMRICFDLVAGHTSNQHPWFKESSRAEKNPYSDWYIWTDSAWNWGDATFKTVNGYSNRDGNYVTNFFHFQPALNYGFAKPDPKQPWQLPITHPACQAVRREMVKIMQFWLDMGVSGFRVDMASSLVKNDPAHKVTSKFWNEVRAHLDKKYPEAVLISEWSVPLEAIPAGFHIDFMIHFGTPAWNSLFSLERYRSPFPLPSYGHSFFDREGKGNIMDFLKVYMLHYKKTKNKGFISLPTGNHDTGRLSQGRTAKEIEVAYAFLLTLPGVPFLYYGDEIGMKYVEGLESKEGGFTRTGSRTPMQWNSDKNAGFSSAAAEKLYLPLDGSKNRPTVANQEKNRNSLLNQVRQLVALRKGSAALASEGDFVPVYAKANTYPFVYLRKSGKERFLIAINPSAKSVTAEFQVAGLRGPGALEMGHGVVLTGEKNRFKLAMDGITYGIFRF
jgi:glycosidase